MKRFIAYATAALLGVGGVVVVAGPASAHHSDISATVSCATGGNYTIKWSVHNWNSDDNNLTAAVTSSSRGVVPTGTALADDQTKTFNETVSNPQNLGLSVSLKWSNGQTATNDGSVGTSSFPDCTETVTASPPSANPPTCQADGALSVPADTAKIDYSQTPAGSGPGTYTVTATAKTGYKITGTKSWSIKVLPKLTGEQCDEAVTPTPPSANPPTCQADGTLVVPADTSKIDYSQTPAGSGPGTYAVTATAKTGYKITGTKSWSVTVLSKLTGEQCDALTTPVEPDVKTITKCDELGSITFATTPGVTYTLTTGNGTSGAYTVTATAKQGYKFANGAKTVFSGNLGTHTECVTATPPTVNPPTCQADGTLSVPNDTSKIDYSQDPAGSGPGAYTVTATAKAGYTITGTKSWSSTVLSKLTGQQCDELTTPVVPNVVAIDECDEFGVITFPTTPGVNYELTQGDGHTGAYTVTATPKPGFKFAKDVQTVFTGNLGAHTTCVTVPPPVEVAPTCDAPGSVSVPTADNVTYELKDLGNGVFKVIVTPAAGFELVGPSEWTIETDGQLNGVECDEFATPVTPTVDPISKCGEYGSVGFTNSAGITYALTSGDGKQGAYEITATANDGFKFNEGTQTTFTGDLGTYDGCPGADDEELLPDTGGATSLLMLLMVGAMVAVGAVLLAAGRQPALAGAAKPAGRPSGPALAMKTLRGTRAGGAHADHQLRSDSSRAETQRADSARAARAQARRQRRE